MKQTIGIDLDTTLNNIEEEWLRLYNEDYDDCLMPSDLTDWNIVNIVKPECGMKIYEYLRRPFFFCDLAIKKNAREVVKWLTEKYDIYIVTAYEVNTCVDKARWVENNLPFIDQRNIIFCNKKGTLNLDYLIDDGAHNIENFKQKGIVFDMPYNRHLNHYARVYDWMDVKRFFLDLEAEETKL